MLLLPRVRPPLTVRNKAVTAYFEIELNPAEGTETMAGRIIRNDKGQLRTDWFADKVLETPRLFTVWDPDGRIMWHVVDAATSVWHPCHATSGMWPDENEWSSFDCALTWTLEESERFDTRCSRVLLTPHQGYPAAFAGAEAWVSVEWALVLEYSEAPGQCRWHVTSLICEDQRDDSSFFLPPART